MSDPDAIWKPGYGGPPPVAPEPSGPAAEPGPATSTGAPRARRRRRGIAIASGLLALASVVAGALVIVDPWGGDGDARSPDPVDSTVFSRLTDRRLPTGVGTLWATQVETAGDHWVAVVGRDLVIVAVEQEAGQPLDQNTPSPVGTRLTGFDALDGERRWSTLLAAEPGDVSFVGSVGDVTVIDVVDGTATVVLGLDTSTGEGVWTARTPEAGGHRAVPGTRYLVRQSDGDDPVLVDGTDGTVVTDPAVVSALSDEVAVIVGGEDPRRIEVTRSSFVSIEPGEVTGIRLEDTESRVVWTRTDGAVVDSVPTLDGRVLLLATRGGAGMQLVDGSTGRTVKHLTMMPGALQSLAVAGDGFVVLEPGDAGPRLVGSDLDGTPRWSIEGSAPVLVGDRIVVRAAPLAESGDGSSTTRVRVTVLGDSEPSN